MTGEFDDIASFIGHLLACEVAIVAAEHKALDAACRVIERDAKRQIGHYQDEVGGFPAWAELADSTEEEKARLGFPLGAPLLRTGELRDSIEHEVSGLEGVVGSKSDIAAYQEFGTATIPARPFIGSAAFKSRAAVERILGEALVIGLTEGEKIHKALGYDYETKG